MEASINFDGTLSGAISGGGGGGGSEVVITPLVTSGTKIADVSVNGVEKDLYCPTVTPTEVEVTQVQQSGTKIASIEVNDQSVDLYAPTPSAPTAVEVTQVQQSGTKIASIDVNGVSTDLYAPEGGGGANYSDTEHIVGVWLDGRPVYEKTMNVSIASPYVSFDLSSLDINTLVMIEGVCKTSTNGYIPLGYSVPSGTQYIVTSYDGGTSTLYVSISSSMTDYNSAYITLRYTKSTDTPTRELLLLDLS